MNNLKYLYEVLIEKVDRNAVDQMDLNELFGTMTEIDDIKIIIVGQDSYPDPEKVTPMAFSYRRGQAATGSVKEILLAALKGKDDHDQTIQLIDGYLGSWRDQGVLLLNSNGIAVCELIKALVKGSKGLCGILLGNEAQKLSHLFNVSFSWNHPSRKSVINNDPGDPRHWNHTDVFWKANEYITSIGRCPINWASAIGHTTLWVFTDGGHSKAKGEGCAGHAIFSSIQSYLGHKVIRGPKLNTNNVAELQAIIMALETVFEYTLGKVIIVSDSEYCIKSITEWHYARLKAASKAEVEQIDAEIEAMLAKTSKKKNTKGSKKGSTKDSSGSSTKKSVKNASGKPVKNLELIEYAIKLTEEIKCKYIHTRGHQPEPVGGTVRERFIWYGNDFVDHLVNYSN